MKFKWSIGIEKKKDFSDLNVARLLCCAILIILENADLMGIFCPTTSNSLSHNNIKTVGSKLGVSHMKAWIHPGLCIGAGGGGLFSRDTLGSLVPTEHYLAATAYLSIIADNVHPIVSTEYSICNGCFQEDNLLCHAQIFSNWFLEYNILK